MFTCTKRILREALKNKDVFLSSQYCMRIAKSNVSTSSKVFSSQLTKAWGQPTAESHPHLINKGEVIPLIQLSEIQERRQTFIETLLSDCCKSGVNLKEHLIVIPSASKQYMSDQIPYVFRQNTDFLYFSGCMEPDSCLVLTINGSDKFCSTIFMREKDSHSELWDGPRTGTEESLPLFGVNQSLPIDEFNNYVDCYIKSNPKSMLWYDFNSPIQQKIHNIMVNCIEKYKQSWASPNQIIHKLRLIKSPSEIKLMKKSCDIASKGISNTIRFSVPGHTEHQIFANVEYECKMNGAEYLAYPPVVAGGDRATIIHYINNNQVISDGEMVLMDAGCEYHGYTSDITRTWPINGKFNNEQRCLYEAVLNVHYDVIKLCYKFPTLDYLFDEMCRLLGIELQKVGIIPKHISEQRLTKMAYQYCPHHVSHYLGMDVHDTPTVPRNIEIRPGMIITIEPGVYINYNHNVPKQFQGIGIRIEDDVLITEDGPLVLSQNCPRTLEDIEKLASENQRN